MMFGWIAVELLLAVVCFGNAETGVLNLMLITSGGGQYNSSGVEPAIDLAVRLINEHEVIPGYQLNIASRGNSSCDRTLSLDAFLSNVSVGSEKIAVFGCGCSLATEAVAEISSFWNITHFSYASSSDALSNRFRFPTFWRTHTRESSLALSVISIMKEYNWTMLKIITQEENVFTQGTQMLIGMLKEENITIVMNGTTSFASPTNLVNITDIFRPEVRIYFLNMYSSNARRVLCAASRQADESDLRFHVPGYVWITLGWYRDQWWTEEVSQDIIPGCTDAMLEPLISQTIGIQQANSAPDKEASTNVNLTAAEFKEQYLASLGDQYYFEPTATYAYDAMWAFAFALNSSLPYFEQQDISIGNFSYSTGKNITDIIQAQLSDNSFGFVGVSGYVEFDETGTRTAPKPQILKYRNETVKFEPVLVAVINETAVVYLNNESSDTVWPGYVPGDGRPILVVIPVKFPLLIVYYVLTSIGICFALVCLFFNVAFRNRKIVRLISPNLNYMIVAGGIMLYASVYFFTVSSIDEDVITVSCHLRMWLLIVGYFSCFGTIVVKMWRVYYIFHNPSGKRKKSRIPKDWHLFLIVMLVCGAMAVVMICVALFGDYKAELVDDNETKAVRNETTKISIQYGNLVCGGPLSLIWVFFNYGCVILTQVVAVILAFRTRKVSIKALNDSKYLTIIIYTSSVIIALMLVGAVLLDKYLNSDAAVFGGLIMLFTTVVLGLTFIPKMVILYKDPKGEYIFERRQSQGTLNLTAVDDSKNEFGDLEKYCTELEGRLGKYEAVVPYRRFTRTSSIRKFSTSVVSPTSVNPLSSVTTTAMNSQTPAQINHATSGYLSEDSSDKAGEGDIAEVKK